MDVLSPYNEQISWRLEVYNEEKLGTGEDPIDIYEGYGSSVLDVYVGGWDAGTSWTSATLNVGYYQEGDGSSPSDFRIVPLNVPMNLTLYLRADNYIQVQFMYVQPPW